MVAVLDSTVRGPSTMSESSIGQWWDPISLTHSHVYWEKISCIESIKILLVVLYWFFTQYWRFIFSAFKKTCFFFWGWAMFYWNKVPYPLSVGCLHSRAFLRDVWCTTFLWDVGQVTFYGLTLEQHSLVMRPLPWRKEQSPATLRVMLPPMGGCLSF